jgi:hypothetical protein
MNLLVADQGEDCMFLWEYRFLQVVMQYLEKMMELQLEVVGQ